MMQKKGSNIQKTLSGFRKKKSNLDMPLANESSKRLILCPIWLLSQKLNIATVKNVS
jgi:hypothetical protein